MSLAEAIEVASTDRVVGAPVQVFLVDPFADDSTSSRLSELVAACEARSGRCVVVAGPCEHPGEEVLVPSAQRASWAGMTLRPPQLPEDVDAQLAAALSSIVVGRRHPTCTDGPASTFDAEAEAVALRSIAVLTELGDGDQPPTVGGVWDGINDETPPSTDAVPHELSGGEPHEQPSAPSVWLRTAARDVAIVGLDEQLSPAAQTVVFLLAAADSEMHVNEVADLTGYSIKTLANAITSTHPLIDRSAGSLRLRKQLWTDHGWIAECVRRLAHSVEIENDTERDLWLRGGFEALRAIEQGPFAVLPVRERSRRNQPQPWGWVDDFPADVPSRSAAESEVAEAALAYTELWCSLPGSDSVRASDLVSVLCHLATVVPYAAIARQVRPSQWTSGAECLLEAAIRVADQDPTLRQRIQRTARAMVARQHLEASDNLADALGL